MCQKMQLLLAESSCAIGGRCGSLGSEPLALARLALSVLAVPRLRPSRRACLDMTLVKRNKLL